MMQVFVVGDRTHTVQVQPSDSVLDVKQNICKTTGLAPAEQRLVFAGRQMQDANTLAQYNVQRGSTFQLLSRLLGSAQLGKAVKGKSKESVTQQHQRDKERKYRQRTQTMDEMDRRKKEAMKQKAMLRAHMEMEQKYTRMNLLKIQNQWRKIMRLAKVSELRKDIDVIKQSHERDVDRKDAIIQMLDRDTEEAEEQYQMALRRHVENIDKLLELQDSRLLALETSFMTQLDSLETEFTSEGAYIDKVHQREKQELLDIIATVDRDEGEREAELKQEFDQSREEIRNKNLEDINVLRITLEGIIDGLETSFEQAHMNYLQATDKRTQEFKFLSRKDQELGREIRQKVRKIERLVNSRNHWLTKISQNEKECKERNRALAEEKNTIYSHFKELKARMNKFRNAQRRRLTALTKSARACKKKLGDHITLAQKILALSELARKLETEQEKVLPFQVDSEAAEMLEHERHGEKDVLTANAEPPTTFVSSAYSHDNSAVEGFSFLDNFYKKYNKVLLDKIAIHKEKQRLAKENTDLQAILKQYLDGISVNQEVMTSENPLLVVNGKVNLHAPVRGNVSNVIIDGNHMVGTGRIGTTAL